MNTNPTPELEAFVVGENTRQTALNNILRVLRTFHTSDARGKLPEEVLPYLADATFSDGAAFVHARMDGSLVFKQRPATEPGATHELAGTALRGEIYELCTGSTSDPLMESHMRLPAIERLGISLPPGSSIIVAAMGPLSLPYWRAAVWRVPHGARPHSTHPYEVWDRQALEITAQLIFLTLDVRDYNREMEYARGIAICTQRFAGALKPRLVYMQQILQGETTDTPRKIALQLEALDKTVDETQRTLLAEREPPEE